MQYQVETYIFIHSMYYSHKPIFIFVIYLMPTNIIFLEPS